MKDTDIITLYNQRDERAIYETHQKYGDYCMSISLGILHNHQDAEECVNDTYLHTWKSIPPKQPSVLRTFLGKLTRNISIDRLRTRRRARRDSEMTVSFEELADILEVVYALARTQKLRPSDLERLRQRKRHQRGGFEDRIFLVGKE